jgi:hypothetical protein
MTKFKLLSTALILSAGFATPVFAQAAISVPGAYAFYHPNGDLGIGSSRPASDALAMAVPHSSFFRMARHGHMSHRVAAKRADRYDVR